jgi:DNA-binding XRE family transcriptional regulator
MCGQVGGEVPSNNVQRFRESLMMSKAELARKSGLSTLTIDRVEAGRACRLDTKRKILLALGMKISDKAQVFGALTSELPAEARQEAVAAPPSQEERSEAAYVGGNFSGEPRQQGGVES